MKYKLLPFDKFPEMDLHVTSEILLHDNAGFSVNYQIKGSVDRIKKLDFESIKDKPLFKRSNELWQSTCFEFFIKPTCQDQNNKSFSNTRYWEFNFGQKNCWNFYEFDSYRKGMKESREVEMKSATVDRQTNFFSLHLELAFASNDSRDLFFSNDFQLAMATIIENKNGEKTFFALKHPNAAKPDFHSDKSFKLVEVLNKRNGHDEIGN